MGEHQCQNSRVFPCPRTDTQQFTVSMDGLPMYQIWLCPKHTRPEWQAARPDRRAEAQT